MTTTPVTAPRRAVWPLYAAGFTTAFGAHGIAASLGGFSEDAVTSLLVLGGLLALYDGAEVLLKPVFGSLADRIGGKPVLLGGLLAFAATAAFVQPKAGRALDAGRLTTRTGLLTGLAVTAAGLAAAMLPGLAGILLAAALIGTGLITPLGFAALAASTPEGRLGQTMGSAELGRELGDAGGPLLVAAVATLSTLTYGYAALALLVAAAPVLALAARRAPVSDPGGAA